MTRKTRLPALATGLVLSLTATTSLVAPTIAFAPSALAQPAPEQPAPSSDPASATPPPAAAPAPDAGAAPAATPAPGPDAGTAAPATAAPADAPQPPPEAPKTADVANPYGLGALWKNGDFVARGVLIILLIMMVGSWYIIVTKLLEQQRLFAAAKAARTSFWSKSSVREGADALKANSPFRYIAENALVANEHHEGGMLEDIDRSSWVTMSIQRGVETIQSRLQGGLAFLATVASASPFVGLFGTVWGIYHALTAIGIAGQASIDKVAGPVGEALIMTAIGLATAVPALLGYNWLVRRNKSALEFVRYFATDVHSVTVSGARVGLPGKVG